MTDKERLEEIKEKTSSIAEPMLYIDWYDTKWLIEQAERAQELDDILEQDHRQEVLVSMYEDNERLKERVQELEREFELCDSAMHMIDMTINNPSTSDDDKWEKINKTIKKYYADDCIHCNGKGFNGLDYYPNCIRGEVIKENWELEQQNKRYREGIKLAMKKTDCDNTWDFLGRLLEGKEETDLPYRIGYKEETE